MTIEKIDRWLAFASTDLAGITAALKDGHKVDETFAYRYSPLRQHPLIRQQVAGEDELICPVPVLAQWRFTTSLYYALLGDKQFTNALGVSFQRVCGEILKRALPAEWFNVAPEAHYGSRQKPRDTPDWIVTGDDECVLVVECKTLRATTGAKAGLTDLAALESDFAKLSTAVVQLYERIAEYRQNQWPQLPFEQKRLLFPLVVTMEDWFLSGKRMSKLLDDKVRAGLAARGIDVAVMDDAPYAVISINDLEQLVQVIAVTGIFEAMAFKLLDDDKRTWLWHGYLVDYARLIPLQRTLFEQEYDKMFDPTFAAEAGHGQT